MPSEDQVQAWLDAYVAAWRSNDRDEIRALFADGVSYAYHPYDEPLRGADAVADSWLEQARRSGHLGGGLAPSLITGDEAIATGESRYSGRRRVLEPLQLGSTPTGRCTRFVGWTVPAPEALSPHAGLGGPDWDRELSASKEPRAADYTTPQRRAPASADLRCPRALSHRADPRCFDTAAHLNWPTACARRATATSVSHCRRSAAIGSRHAARRPRR